MIAKVALAPKASFRSFSDLIAHFIARGEIVLPYPATRSEDGLDFSGLPTIASLEFPSSSNPVNARFLCTLCNENAPDSARVVVTERDNGFASLVALFALATGAQLKLVKSVGQVDASVLVGPYRSVLIVADPRQLTAELLARMWASQSTGPLRVGYVPCRTADEFSYFAGKRLFADRLYSDFRGSAALVRDGAAGLEYQPGIIRESNFSAIDAERLLRPIQFVCYEFHAKETCAKFGDHVFCGLPAKGAGMGRNGTRPGCADDVGCVWQPMARVPVQSTRAAHVIAVSCGSLRVGDGLFSDEFGLGLNLFRGSARSFISPSRFVVGNSLLSAILCDLVMSGERLGEVAFRANQLVAATGQDGPSFVLLGDPDDVVDVEAAYGEVDDQALRSFWQEDSKHPSLASSQILVDEPPAPSQVTGLPDGLFWRLTAGEPESADSSSLLDRLRLIDSGPGFWPSLAYSDGHRVLDERRYCHVCGQSCVVYERKHVAGLWQREVINCPRCGLVADVPASTYDRITLHAPNEIAGTEELEVRSKIFSSTGEGELPVCNFSVIHSDDFGWSSWNLGDTIVTSLSDCTVARQCSIVPPAIFPFVYWLRASWITRDGFFWMSRPLSITAPARMKALKHKPS